MRRAPEIFSALVLRHAADYRITALDLGARGGVNEDIAALTPATVMIGFEPDQAESKRLQAADKGRWLELRILPYAIGGSTGPATLYVPRNPEGASLLPHNGALVDEFGHVALHHTVKQIPVAAVTLDFLASDQGIDRIDYLKVDIEGAELDVLRAGERLLKTCKVIKVECAFLEQRVGQPLAAEVVSYLTACGFELIDILDLQRWRRRPLPAHPYMIGSDVPYSRGRVSQADFLFARRFAPGADAWDVSAAVLLLAALGYVDHAVTLLRKSPEAAAWWSAHNIEIERELREVSRKLGAQQIRNALWQQLRGFVPLARSRLGLLPFHRPEKDY
jgi:FkbM family methyltransferase